MSLFTLLSFPTFLFTVCLAHYIFSCIRMGTIVVFSTEISSITHLIYIIPEAQSKFNRYLVVPYETAAFIDKEQFNISSFIWFSLILVDRWDFSRKVLISKEVTETHSQYCKIISTNVIKLLFFFFKTLLTCFTQNFQRL